MSVPPLAGSISQGTPLYTLAWGGMDTSSPLPPSVGEGWDGGEEALVPPPPEPSPVKGEGQSTSASEPSVPR
jgi:hypothetical protein